MAAAAVAVVVAVAVAVVVTVAVAAVAVAVAAALTVMSAAVAAVAMAVAVAGPQSVCVKWTVHGTTPQGGRSVRMTARLNTTRRGMGGWGRRASLRFREQHESGYWSETTAHRSPPPPSERDVHTQRGTRAFVTSETLATISVATSWE